MPEVRCVTCSGSGEVYAEGDKNMCMNCAGTGHYNVSEENLEDYHTLWDKVKNK